MSKTFSFQVIQFSQIVLIQTIYFGKSMQFCLINRWGPIRCYHSGPEWTWEKWQWRGTPNSSKLQHHWNLTIRLFSVIYRALIEGGGRLTYYSRCILQPQLTGQYLLVKIFFSVWNLYTNYPTLSTSGDL